jgi:hypothetical protein
MRMWMRDFGGAWMAAIVLAVAVAVNGCGSSDPEAAPAGQGGAKPAKLAARAHPDMVAAVSASRFPGPIDLQFAIPHRPVVGQPIDIQLVLTPSVELERIVARFQATEGLEVVKGADTGRLDKPAPGVEISHTLTVLPKADGIYSITAIVLTDSATESVARTFSIPLIAGAGFAEPAPTSDASPPAGPSRP